MLRLPCIKRFNGLDPRSRYGQSITILTSTAGIGEIDIAWEFTGTFDNLLIRYSTNPDMSGFTEIDLMSAVATTGTITGLLNDTEYFYVVVGVKGIKEVVSAVTSTTTLSLYEIYAADPLNDNAEIG